MVVKEKEKMEWFAPNLLRGTCPLVNLVHLRLHKSPKIKSTPAKNLCHFLPFLIINEAYTWRPTLCKPSPLAYSNCKIWRVPSKIKMYLRKIVAYQDFQLYSCSLRQKLVQTVEQMWALVFWRLLPLTAPKKKIPMVQMSNICKKENIINIRAPLALGLVTAVYDNASHSPFCLQTCCQLHIHRTAVHIYRPGFMEGRDRAAQLMINVHLSYISINTYFAVGRVNCTRPLTWKFTKSSATTGGECDRYRIFISPTNNCHQEIMDVTCISVLAIYL